MQSMYVHQLGIQNIKRVLAQCFYRRLQVVTKFISICHELCLYVVGINLSTSTSIALLSMLALFEYV